jgi:predicted Fe-S protein YdhL (DUF1289 family)
VCRGCKRFSHEVINWNSYTEQQKRIIDKRLSGFLSQCVSNKLRVLDRDLLQWQLRVQQISYNSSHDEYCWAYSLIKAGASQIDDQPGYGFQVDIKYRDVALVPLREMIDEEFFSLPRGLNGRYRTPLSCLLTMPIVKKRLLPRH